MSCIKADVHMTVMSCIEADLHMIGKSQLMYQGPALLHILSGRILDVCLSVWKRCWESHHASTQCMTFAVGCAGGSGG